MEQILDQITILLSSDVDVITILSFTLILFTQVFDWFLMFQELLAKNILTYLERVVDNFLCETAVLGIKLLQKVQAPYLVLEISQFCCYAISHIRTRKMLFSDADRKIIRKYLFQPIAHAKYVTFYKKNNMEQLYYCIGKYLIVLRYPRLVAQASKALVEDLPSFFHANELHENPIIQWCCEEFSDAEGVALAKMLGSLKYTQVINVLNKPNFNLSLLQHYFRNLRNQYHLVII